MLNILNVLVLCVLTALVISALLIKHKELRPVTRWERAVLWTLILLLTGLRLLRFGSVPGGMNQDGAMAAVDALALSRYGTDRFGMRFPAHFTAWGYGQMSVLMSWCMVPFIRLFGLSVTTARLPCLLWSLGGMAAFYCFLRVSRGERTALAGLLLLAANPWHFMQSRWALDCNLFPHCFLLGFTLLYLGRRRSWALYLSMLPFALCMYSYGVSFLIVPLFLVSAVLVLHVPLRRVLVCVLLYLGLSWPIYGTMLINAMGWKSLSLPFMTLPYFPHSVRSNDILFFSQDIGRQLLTNARSLWRVGFLQSPDLIWNAIDGFGTVYLCSMPLLLYGLGLTVRDTLRRDQGSGLLLCWWLCSLFLGLCVNGVNVNRLNILFYENLLLIARGTEGLLASRRWTAPAILCCFALLSSMFFYSYFTDWAQRMRTVFYADFIEAVRFAGELDTERFYITPDTQSPNSAAVSEILTLFTLQTDAEFFQGNSEKRPAYAEKYRYISVDPASLPEGHGSVACVLRGAGAVPDGWEQKSFGTYRVLWREG